MPGFGNTLWGTTFGYGLLFVLGATGAYFMYKRRKPQDLIFLSAILAAYLGLFHFYVTYPLFGILFQPHKFHFILTPALAVAAAFGVKGLIDIISKEMKLEGKKMLLVILVMVLLIPFGPSKYYETAMKNDWGANDPVPDIFADTTDWISDNTPKDAIIAANPLTAFMVNSLTGRRVVVNEMGHSSPFSELERLTYEINTIYSTPDDEIAYTLLKKNGATYVVVNLYEIQYYGPAGGLEKFFNSPHYTPVTVFEYNEGGTVFSTAILEVN